MSSNITERIRKIINRPGNIWVVMDFLMVLWNAQMMERIGKFNIGRKLYITIPA